MNGWGWGALIGVASTGVLVLVLAVIFRDSLRKALADDRVTKIRLGPRGLTIHREPDEQGGWRSYDYPPEIEVKTLGGGPGPVEATGDQQTREPPPA